MIVSVLLLYRFILVCMYCSSGCTYLKVRSLMVPAKQDASNRYIPSCKRPVDLTSDEDRCAQHKRNTVSRTRYSIPDVGAGSSYQEASIGLNEGSLKRKADLGPYVGNIKKKVKITPTQVIPTKAINQGVVFERIPNNSFFRSFKYDLSKQDSPFTQDIIKKLLACIRFKIPYTILSSTIKKYKDLDGCDAVLNKILVKRDGAYKVATQVQQIRNTNIQMNTLSSMLYSCGNQAAKSFERLINLLTEKQMVDKLNKLKKRGFAMSNLSSMLLGCNNKIYKAFKTLINNLTKDEMLDKFDLLKSVGFEISNLSSMLDGCGNQALASFEKLVNLLTEKQMVDKLNKLKKRGFAMSNLSSMLHGCGNQAPASFEALVKLLTEKQMVDKLNKLKSVGFAMNNLSTMLTGCRNQAPASFEKLVKLITRGEVLAQLQKVQEIGFEMGNLSSILAGCNYKTFKTLINNLTKDEMLDKLDALKSVGFEVRNLSSMLHGCGNQAPASFEALVRLLTKKQMMDKLNKLKTVGFGISNLSTMLSGCGNQAPALFEKLVKLITRGEVLSKLQKLKEVGFGISNLCSMLAGCRNKAPDRLTNIINLLTNHTYIDTVKKITAAMYTSPDVISQNDAILVSRSASERLKAIGDLRKIKFVRDPSNDKPFKKFLTNCYKKNKHVDDSLMQIQKVAQDDPRESLRGQDKVVAKKKIHKDTILGIYTGILLCDQMPIDHELEASYLATKGIYGFNKINSYSFGIMGSLYVSACGRGNILMKINANKTYNHSAAQSSKANVSASLNSCDGTTPFILFYATQDIATHTELLFDYGKQYWDNHNNNNDLSNPDAEIYREIFKHNKYASQAESISFIKLVKDYDYDLYQNLLKNIETPSRDFSDKDRVVECRKIDDPQAIKYRIYKVPGESCMGDPSQDYFSVSLEKNAILFNNQ